MEKQKREKKRKKDILIFNSEILLNGFEEYCICSVFFAHLKTRSLAGELLIVQHGLQDFPVTSRHQTHSAHDLQNRHFGLYVLGG